MTFYADSTGTAVTWSNNTISVCSGVAPIVTHNLATQAFQPSQSAPIGSDVMITMQSARLLMNAGMSAKNALAQSLHFDPANSGVRNTLLSILEEEQRMNERAQIALQDGRERGGNAEPQLTYALGSWLYKPWDGS